METDGSDPDQCSPVQIAAVMIDPLKLEIIPKSEFNINLKPEKLLLDSNYAYEDSDVLDFHSKVRACSKEDILSSWRQYPDQKNGWERFVSYLDMYHTRSTKKSFFSAPIAAGYNINRFDMKIIN